MSARCCTRCGHEAAYDGQGLWWCGNDDCDNNMPIDGKRILSEPPRADLPPRAEQIALLRTLAAHFRYPYNTVVIGRKEELWPAAATTLDAIAAALAESTCAKCGEQTEPVCCNGNCPDYGAHDSFYGATPREESNG